jgi:hypothetical protein
MGSSYIAHFTNVSMPALPALQSVEDFTGCIGSRELGSTCTFYSMVPIFPGPSAQNNC